MTILINRKRKFFFRTKIDILLISISKVIQFKLKDIFESQKAFQRVKDLKDLHSIN